MKCLGRPAALFCLFTLLLFPIACTTISSGSDATPSGSASEQNDSESNSSNEDLYLAGNKAIALLLAHGRGKDPAWLVVEPLRHAVQQQLGYHTLSLQMPNDDIEFNDFGDEFPKAYAVFKRAIARLQKLGINKIYLMGHSMGARMASAFIAEYPKTPIAGLIVAGCRNNGGEPLACDHNLQMIDIPVLDIWGAANRKDRTAAAQRTYLKSPQYRQVAIDGANHTFEGKETEFTSAVVEWLREQNTHE